MWTSKKPSISDGLNQVFAYLIPTINDSPVPKAHCNLMANPEIYPYPFLYNKIVQIQQRALFLKTPVEQWQIASNCAPVSERLPLRSWGWSTRSLFIRTKCSFSWDSLARAPLESLLKSCEELLLMLHKYLESILRLPWLKRCLIKKKKILTRQILQPELFRTINWPADIFYIKAL